MNQSLFDSLRYQIKRPLQLIKRAGGPIRFTPAEEKMVHELVTQMIIDFENDLETSINVEIAKLERQNPKVDRAYIRNLIEEKNLIELYKDAGHIFSTQTCTVEMVNKVEKEVVVKLLMHVGPEKIANYVDYNAGMAGGSGGDIYKNIEGEFYKDRYGYRIQDERTGDVMLFLNCNIKVKDVRRKQKDIITANIGVFVHELSHSKDIVTSDEAVKQYANSLFDTINQFGPVSILKYDALKFFMRNDFYKKTLNFIRRLQIYKSEQQDNGIQFPVEKAVKVLNEFASMEGKKFNPYDIQFILMLITTVPPNNLGRIAEELTFKETTHALGYVTHLIAPAMKEGVPPGKYYRDAHMKVYENYINSPSEIKARLKQLDYTLRKIYNLNELKKNFYESKNKSSFVEWLVRTAGDKYFSDTEENKLLINDKNKKMVYDYVYKLLMEPMVVNPPKIAQDR